MHERIGRRTYLRLVAGARRGGGGEDAWTALMAAHVLGQPDLRLHVDSHRRMLALAWRERDACEVGGQLLRLALVPLGHALGRLPAGNVGRATVPALRAMEPPPHVAALVRAARRPLS